MPTSGARSSTAVLSSSAAAVGGLQTDGPAPTTGIAPADSASGSYDAARTVALPMSVRVVNLYLPKGSDTPTPIEVWTGAPANGGKKLATVPYGQAGAYFAPEVADPMGQGASGPNTDYSLSFYATGHTGADDELISQGEKSAPGEKLTMVATPGDADSKGLTLQVVTDDLGSAPQGSGFTTVSLPPPPEGKALLSINATALQYRKGGSDLSLTPSTTAGKCLAYLDPDTGKLHDMGADTMNLVGGTTSLAYPMGPATSFRLNSLKDQESVADACADAPVAGPFDPGLSAGQHAYGFLYGPNLSSAKFLVVPVG